MTKYLLIAFFFIVAPILFAQSDAVGALPSDPNALLDMAAPYYDYGSSEMKPWHISYHYQYYDESGLPSAEGEFDYWWSTIKVSRASWTQGNQSHIEWHTADGKELRSITGNDIPSMALLRQGRPLPPLQNHRRLPILDPTLHQPRPRRLLGRC